MLVEPSASSSESEISVDDEVEVVVDVEEPAEPPKILLKCRSGNWDTFSLPNFSFRCFMIIDF